MWNGQVSGPHSRNPIVRKGNLIKLLAKRIGGIGSHEVTDNDLSLLDKVVIENEYPSMLSYKNIKLKTLCSYATEVPFPIERIYSELYVRQITFFEFHPI